MKFLKQIKHFISYLLILTIYFPAIASTVPESLLISTRAKILAQQAIISGAVHTGLAGATGENVGQVWKDEVLSGGLALTQAKIGDIAQDKGLNSGSPIKTALHSATGALYSLSTNSKPLSGIIGGISSELVAGLMESSTGLNGPPLTKEQQQTLNNNIKATTKLTSATVTMLAGGNAKDITLSANVGESAIKYNRELHESEQNALLQLKKEATTEQEKQDLEDAAAFMTQVHAGIDPDEDPQNYAQLLESYQRGKDKIEAQQKLVARTKLNQRMDFAQGMVPSSMGGDSTKLLSGINARHFDYDWVDQGLDTFTRRHDRVATTLGQTTQLLGGIGGMFASGALTLESIKSVNTTGVALSSAGVALSSVYAYDGLDALLSPYKNITGERAMASLKSDLPGLTSKSKATFSLANTLLDVGGISAGAKVLSTLQKAPTSSISATTQVENTISGDSSHLYGAKVRDATVKGETFVTSSSEVASSTKKITTKPSKNTGNKTFSSRTDARYQPGVVSGGDSLAVVRKGDKWFRGTEANAAKIPKQIADQLKGREFKSFDEFRQTMWKLVAEDPVLSKNFTLGDLARMKKQGRAPKALDSQRYNGRSSYEIHHSTPINRGGGVYDIDNLVIVTPKYHNAILDPKYHGGK